MVNFASILTSAAAAGSLISTVAAHPGEKHDHAKIEREISVRGLRAAAAKRSLADCQDTLKHRSLMRRSEARRANALDSLREKRGITTKSKKYRRDLALLQEFENVNHNMTGSMDYTPNTLASDIFAANTSCILSPEVTDGPYYVTGEMIRKNVVEDQTGIDLYLEVQYVDVTTCEPVPKLYVDVWNCNSTGFYSGVESGQGGLNTTFLRGVQETDEDGVVAFETLFPGHYEGRATHTHLLTKTNVTVRSNGTTGSDGAVTHIGQLFWPEDLKDEVEAVEPYASNTQAYTTNDEDMWSIVQADNDFDPFPEYVYLGDSVADGLMAWIQIGINATADYTDDDYYNVAADYQAGGGVANEDAMGMGGQGGGNGTMPTGAMPSGAMPSGAAPSNA
ncbi:aromatic compound dioxygenase [Stemphylium lycopersici]|nr:gpi anchored protein [Stemphylium lycopersici]RAR11992.1 aromatic compound dioxygenase [Stemphylium lycopersici]